MPTYKLPDCETTAVIVALTQIVESQNRAIGLLQQQITGLQEQTNSLRATVVKQTRRGFAVVRDADGLILKMVPHEVAGPSTTEGG